MSRDDPVWERDGRDWPNREASRFVHAGGLRWHVQVMGEGPVILLIHGTGAATHSWRGLLPLLAPRFKVIAPDLPGHGFTERPPAHRLSLPGMAGALWSLLQALDASPLLVVGHSAGAAILIRMTLDGYIAPFRIVSLNGALQPFRGLPGTLFSPIARLIAGISLVPQLFARQAADPAAIRRLADNTGSKLDDAGLEFYRRLAQRPGHIAGAFGMMAHWDLHSFAKDLPRLEVPLVLIVGTNDRTVRPAEAFEVRAVVENATVVRLRGLGHLAHEERPEEVVALIAEQAREAGLLD